MQTTLAYYRVTEKRVRSAVEDVSRHQFDGQGRPVLTAVAGLLADEHTRLRVGQVAVPFGICTEPSNVKAGGHACPYKFTCIGCGHFRSDPSYLRIIGNVVSSLLLRESPAATWSPFAFKPVGVVMMSETID